MTSQLFIQLIRIALGNADKFEVVPMPLEWEQLLFVSARQGVPGIAFSAVEALPQQQRPPLEVLTDWYAVVNRIENRNRQLNALAARVCSNFQRDGKNICVMKGQAMAMLYPQPLRRTYGDIDVWMEGGRQAVVDYVSKNFPTMSDGGERGHHVSTVWKGTELEVHFIPAKMYNPLHTLRLRRFFDSVQQQQYGNTVMLTQTDAASGQVCEIGTINVPTTEFNLVFILAHLFHHWAFEGCGMKPLIDYYWLTKAAAHDRGCNTAEALRVIHAIGLDRFLAAVMFIFSTLGMDSGELLCPPDKHLGAKLLDDILANGLVDEASLAGMLSQENKFHKFFRRLRRMLRLQSLARTELFFCFVKNIIAWATGRTR